MLKQQLKVTKEDLKKYKKEHNNMYSLQGLPNDNNETSSLQTSSFDEMDLVGEFSDSGGS